MPPEKLSEVKSWFSKAENDLRACRVDIEADPPLIEDAVFHCQQACEKAMKGYLTYFDKTFGKTHDLDELINACKLVDASLSKRLDSTRDLTPYATVFRYPGESAQPSKNEAEQCLKVATAAVQLLKSLIGSALK